MSERRGQFVSDTDYVARIRRYKPSSLIPIIAEVGAALSEPGSWLQAGTAAINPWALADIARVSLVSGNEYRQSATRGDLSKCLSDYWLLDEPQAEQDAVMSFLFRKTLEQLGFSESRYHNLLRTAALFAQTTPPDDLTIIRPGWFEELFGCTLSQYVGVGFIVHSVASTHAGRFDEAWLEQETAVQPILEKIPLSLMTQVIEKNFTGDVSHFRKERIDFGANPLRRYTFNPLLDRPMVSGLTEERLVPVPSLIDKKISPLGIWYSGFFCWDEAFATEVGHLFERYVGRHLELIPKKTLIQEIPYDGGKRSVDWIVVMERAVLLVEVKSTRPTEPIRLGSPAMWEVLSTKLSKAYAQVEKASRCIGESHSAFSEVPPDLPRLGLIVTMERFPLVNTPEVRERIDAASTIPTIVCCSEELELLVTLRGEDIDSFLLEFLTRADPDGFDLHNELTKRNHDDFCRNTVMDAAWEAYDWGLPPLDDDGEY